MKTWLNLHVFTGLFGSLSILFHSAFQFRTPIALVTAISLGVVVVTGIAGRYLYALTPRPIPRRSTMPYPRWTSGPRIQRARPSGPRDPKVTQVDTHHWLVAELSAVPRWTREARTRGFLVSYAIEDVPMSRALERRNAAFSKGKAGRAQVRDARSRRGRRVVTVAVVARFLIDSWRSSWSCSFPFTSPWLGSTATAGSSLHDRAQRGLGVLGLRGGIAAAVQRSAHATTNRRANFSLPES